MPKHLNKKVIASNRKARFNYDIKKTYLAGIVLKGFEVKSCIYGLVNFKDSYIRIENDEAWVINAHITKWKFANVKDYKPDRKRKLLLNFREIRALALQQESKNMSIVPLRMIQMNGRVKLEIGVGKGRKKYDKRARIREKEDKREVKEQLDEL